MQQQQEQDYADNLHVTINYVGCDDVGVLDVQGTGQVNQCKKHYAKYGTLSRHCIHASQMMNCLMRIIHESLNIIIWDNRNNKTHPSEVIFRKQSDRMGRNKNSKRSNHN